MGEKEALLGRYDLEAKLAVTERELRAVYDNLTATQIRCNEILEEKRVLSIALRLLAEVGALNCIAETPCGDCVRCRAKALVTT